MDLIPSGSVWLSVSFAPMEFTFTPFCDVLSLTTYSLPVVRVIGFDFTRVQEVLEVDTSEPDTATVSVRL